MLANGQDSIFNINCK